LENGFLQKADLPKHLRILKSFESAESLS